MMTILLTVKLSLTEDMTEQQANEFLANLDYTFESEDIRRTEVIEFEFSGDNPK